MVQAQNIKGSWLQDAKGRGIAFDGQGIISRNVHIADDVRLMLLDAFHDAVERERGICAAICESNAQLQMIRAKAEGNDYAAERSIEATKCAAGIRSRSMTAPTEEQPPSST